MKTFNGLIDFFLKVLVITNLWIILFTNSLTYLSFLYPPIIKEHLLRNIAFPNPFKIPLYIVMTLISVTVIWVVQKLCSINLRVSIFLKLPLLILLCLLFLSKLGIYPMAGDIFPYTIRADTSIYSITIGLFLVLIAFITIQFAVVSTLIRKNPVYSLFLFGFLIIIVAFFTFEPGFPLSGHDYSFFFGPILEIAKGKTIYTDIPIQHGFLSILTFTLFYKLNLLQLAYLPFFIWLLYIIQYVLSFFLVYKLSKSIGFSLIGLFSILILNYFSLSDLPASYPQIGPMRWLASILAIFLFLRLKKIDDKRLIFVLPLMSLWLIDAGIALILGYLLTLFFFFIARLIDLKRVIKSVVWLLISFSLIFLFITGFHLLFGYKAINILNIFHSLQKYASLGIAQLPIESHTYFWVVMFIYFTGIIYFVAESQQLYAQLILFSANLMLFSSIYYVGRAHPHNLFNISLLPILTIFLFLGLLWTKLKSHHLKITFALICFILFIAYPAYMRRITMTEMIIVKLKRLTAGNIFKSEMKNILTKRYSKETQLIINNLKDDKIAILSLPI